MKVFSKNALPVLALQRSLYPPSSSAVHCVAQRHFSKGPIPSLDKSFLTNMTAGPTAKIISCFYRVTARIKEIKGDYLGACNALKAFPIRIEMPL